ncbi:MAG TPA: hypothetical protein VEV83_21610 [Parafilimonas sp.]|nr:hypothetical protein [Parafilimonas sp.]
MFWKKLNILLFLFFASGILCYDYGQSQTVNAQEFSGLNNQPLREKIFAHTDKDFYLAGEILWFKLYDVSGDSLKPIDVSNVAYVEILNANQKPVLQATVALENGRGNGSFYLPSSITSGNYIFRVYTNWMKNFSADKYFQKDITIVNTLTKLAAPAKNDSNSYEVGFFPEGGDLVENIESKVGVKVTDHYGHGINCSGNIVDGNNRTIASFSTFKFGMGSFYFTPQNGQTYKAIIQADDSSFVRALPPVKAKGYVMHIAGSGEDNITVAVRSNVSEQAPVYLVAYSNDGVHAAFMQPTTAGGDASFIMGKKQLPPGITHLVLFNSTKQPVCERLVFLRPQALQLQFAADKNVYEKRSAVTLGISASDSADLSLGVYLLDSLQGVDHNSILSYLWLTSELNGKIDSADYYFSDVNHASDSALDNLLLTQGWSRFKEQSTQPLLRFAPEREGHLIEGTVINKNSGAPTANIRVYLSVPGQHFRFATSVSNDSGHVFFDIKDFYGSGELIVQTGKEDSAYRVEIADPFSNQTSGWLTTPLSLRDDALRQLSQRNVGMQVENAYTINQLNRFGSPALDTNAFYGVPDSKYFLDDYVRFNTMEEVLREYVVGVDVRIRQGNYSLIASNYVDHTFFEKGPLVLIDGVPIFDMNKLIAYNPLKIKKAEVVLKKYYINSLVADGIVSYSTYKGDLDGFQFDPGTIELSYDGLQLQREFYSPQYATTEQKEIRVPDYRNVLYWAPQITTKQDREVSFYTSDVKGKYIAVIQGIGINGKAGYATTEFEVK